MKVPPPIVALLIGLSMWLASLLLAPVEIPFGLRVSVAVAIACFGAVIGITAIITFRKARTTMDPTKPESASVLVTGGVFRVTRNPMYLGLVLYLLAWAVYLSNWMALLLLPLFVLYINRFQITPEEHVLSSIFGPEYDAYREKVRRWL
jgi:protein-S-isoprenylcysteine O-methyltransferase Ste14